MPRVLKQVRRRSKGVCSSQDESSPGVTTKVFAGSDELSELLARIDELIEDERQDKR
jgi:hypothetical protein